MNLLLVSGMFDVMHFDKKALLPVPLKSVNIAASATMEDSRYACTKAKYLS